MSAPLPPLHDCPPDVPRHLTFLAKSICRSVRLSTIVGRKIDLRRQGNEWCGPSPFATDRGRNLFLNDEKGFYHCFCSGRHGDVVRFVMETEGKTFEEAVTALAPHLGVRAVL